MTEQSETGPWHEDERFWETFRDAMFPPEKFEEAPEEVDALLELAGVSAGANTQADVGVEDAAAVEADADAGGSTAVLDVPCGVGRHSVEFASRGFDVTGVDATAPYVEEARERARETGVDVEFVHEDMRAFARPGAFDLAVNLYTSFGYFEKRTDDEVTARNVHESLRPGGTFVLDVAGKETLARDFRERTWRSYDDGYVLEEHTVTDDWTWVENEWVLVVDGETREFDVSHRLYSAYELRTLLDDVGFASVDVYGDYEGNPYDDNADRLLVVAEKRPQ